MKIPTLLFTLTFLISCAGKIIDTPPKKWWKNKVTIDEVETKEYIGGFLNRYVVKDPDWIKLKKLYIKGDSIYMYKYPRFSGPVGYILVRNNKVIVDVIVADQ